MLVDAITIVAPVPGDILVAAWRMDRLFSCGEERAARVEARVDALAATSQR